MGMVKLFADNEAKTTANRYQPLIVGTPDEIVGKISSGEIDIAAMTGDTQDVYLWHMQYNKNKVDGVTIGTKLIAGAAHDYTAIIQFNKVTGTSTLNPVPVPAAAWLLGSGLLGLVGLRRRKA
jgi:hypothetical protein